MIQLLSVRVTNITEKTFSIFSRDPSRSLTLYQHCTRYAQWATNMSMWACLPPPFSIHWYAAIFAMGKLAWAFVSNERTVCSISSKQAFYSLKPPGKSYVHQVGVRFVRMAYFRFYNFRTIVFCSPFRHTCRNNIAHVQSQRTRQIWTCTPRLQLPGKLCLMRLGLTEEFLRTFSCPLLSLHLKWPLCIRYWCVVLICYRFC